MSGFRMRRLGELTEILSGYPFASERFGGTGEVPIVRIRDLATGCSSTFYSGEYDPKYIICDGDLLIGMDGEFNRARWQGGKALLNQRVCRVAASSQELDENYLYHFLPAALKAIEDATPFATVKHLSVKSVRNIQIPLPSIAKQRRIADVLDRAESLESKRRAVLAQLDDLTQSIYLDLFGDPKSNQRKYPVVPMGSLFSDAPIFGTMLPPVAGSGDWLSIRVANIKNWQLDLSDEKHVALPSNMVERHSVRDGDLLMARAIASQGHLGKSIVAYPGSRKWAFDSHLMRLRFEPTRAHPEFIRHLLMTPGGRQLFLKSSRRSAVQFNVNTKEIAALQIPLPPFSLQSDFARRVAAVERMKNLQHKSLAEMDALLASLQHRAFRGEL